MLVGDETDLVIVIDQFEELFTLADPAVTDTTTADTTTPAPNPTAATFLPHSIAF